MAETSAKQLPVRMGAAISIVTLSLFSGGCAQLGELPSLTASNTFTTAEKANANAAADTELEVATKYWGERFGKTPMDLEAGLAYAKNLKAMGRKRQAMAVLQQSAIYHGDNRELASEYGRLALDLGQVAIAEKVLAQAENPAKPDWRVVSARGTVMAKKGHYDQATHLFEQALTLAPNQPSLLNNLAMAHAMSGDPAKAEELLRQAIDAGGDSKRVRQNLALVLGLQGRYEESATVGAQDLPKKTAEAETAAIRQLVKLEPVAGPSSTWTTQFASAPALKGTNTQQDGHVGWDTKVAEAAQ